MLSLGAGRASLDGVTTSGRASRKRREAGGGVDTAERTRRPPRGRSSGSSMRSRVSRVGLHSAVRRGGDDRPCDRTSVVRFRPGLHLHTGGRRARAGKKAPRVEIRPEPDVLARSRSLRARRDSGSRRVPSRTDSLVASLPARGSRQKAPRVRFDPEGDIPARHFAPARAVTPRVQIHDGVRDSRVPRRPRRARGFAAHLCRDAPFGRASLGSALCGVGSSQKRRG